MTSTATAQPATGRVVDETGTPIAGATVMQGETITLTDETGAFTVTSGGTIMVSADGFAIKTATARDGVVVRLAHRGDEVIEVSGKAPNETKPLEYRLTADDIRRTPGAANDALRAVTVLPAAARIPFSFGGIVLRGMSPRDSSVLIDGVEIPIAFHFGGITSVFPTQILEDMRVVPSGFDASIGRTQGGVVELATRRPRGDRFRSGGEVSLLHSLAYAEGPLPGHGAFLLSLRRSYLDLIARPLADPDTLLPSYSDGQLRAVWGDRKKRGELGAYVLGSLDGLATASGLEPVVTPEGGDTAEEQSDHLGFVRTGVTYKKASGRSLFTLAPMVGANVLSYYTKTTPPAGKPTVQDLRRNWFLFGTRAEWVHDDAGGFVRAGLDVEGGHLGRVKNHAPTELEDDIPLPRNTVEWADAAVFLETRRQWFDDKLSIRPGVRVERFGLGNQWAFDPRLNAHVSVSADAKLTGSIGRFHQPPSPAHFDEFADNLKAKSSYVDQATLGIEATPTEGLTTSVTVFGNEGKKTLVDVAANSIREPEQGFAVTVNELLEEQFGLYAFQANIGRERSYGIESALRYDRPSYRLMANLALSRSKRQYEPALMLGWEPYGLDQPVRVNLLGSKIVGRWSFGSRVTVASGNPLRLVPENTVQVEGMPEPPTVLERLPWFWQVDVRVDRTWKRSWGDLMAFVDIQNVTNHRNVETRDSNPDFSNIYRYRDTHGLPIIPYIGVELAPR